MSHRFGNQLSQHLHRKHGLSQSKLAAGILQDPSIIGKMCKGERLTGPQARKRVLEIIFWLHAQGVLDNVDEANALLDAAGMAAGRADELAGLALIDQAPKATSRASPTPQTLIRCTNLPAPLTSFVGRTQELAEVRALLTTTRLLTLTGSGGTGKTRLAFEVGSELLPSYADGVWLVELAPLDDPTLVLPTIAATFDLREVPGITLLDLISNSLRNKHLLLILDNCEHLVAVCAKVAEHLLRACPAMQILASSREALHIGGETLYHVPSLAVPNSLPLPLETLRHYEAILLFVARAAAAQPRFTLSERNVAAVVRICRQLDGIPLAIELAAARASLLTAEEIAARLEESFSLLSGGSRTALPRQQTLRATFDWSYELLLEIERTLLRQLSVFAGGWTLAAAHAVTNLHSQAPSEVDIDKLNIDKLNIDKLNIDKPNMDEVDVLEVLARLFNKSLVTADLLEATHHEGGTRYRLLETVRQYARGKLLERVVEAAEVPHAPEEAAEVPHAPEEYVEVPHVPEEYEVRDRHLAYYLQLAEAGEPNSRGPHQLRQLDHYAVEADNYRAALHWGAQRNPDAALRLAGTLAEFWARRGDPTEGRAWLQALIDQINTLPEPQGEAAQRRRAAQAKAQLGLANVAFVTGDVATAWVARAESVRLYRQLEDRRGLGWALGMLGYAAMLRGDGAGAERAYAEAITLGRETDDKLTLSFALGMQSRLLLLSHGDLAAAQTGAAESDRLAREIGMPWAMAQAALGLAGIATYTGQWEEARAYTREAVNHFHQLGDRFRFNGATSELAHIERRAGKLEAALQHYHQTILLWQELGQRAAVAHQLECLGFLARRQHQLPRAARLLGAAEALREAIDASMSPVERAEYDREISALHDQMGDESDNVHWATGRTMTMDEAIAYALE